MIKKTIILVLSFFFAFSFCLYADENITVARRMKILIADFDSSAPETSILNGKTIAEELEKHIFDSQAMLEKIIPLKREEYKELSGLKLENILEIIKKGQELGVEGLIVGKATKNEKGLYNIQLQLIDVQKKDIPSTRRVINFAEAKDVEETAESLSVCAGNIVSALAEGVFPRVDIITPNFDIVSILQINKDNFPEIKLSVSIVNKKGDPVSVPPDLFEIRENGNMVMASVQKVKGGEDIDVPITVLLVIDRSPSMLEEVGGKKTGEPFKRAKAAALEFVSKLSPIDKIKIIAFDYEVLPLGDYTEDKKYYIDKLNKLKVGKGTGLYNALKYSVEDLAKIEGEKAVIFLTDGINDVRKASPEVKKITLQDGLKIAKDHTVPVYTIGFGGADEKILSRIAEETHSIFFKAASSEKLRELYLKIHMIIENQYIISYQSLADKSGKVKVTLNIKDDEREFVLSPEEQEKAADYKKDRALKKESEKIKLKKKEIENERRLVEEERKKLKQDIKNLEEKKKKIESEKKELARLKSELSEKEKLASERKKQLDLKQKKLEKKESLLKEEEQELEKRKKRIIEIEKNIINAHIDILDFLKMKIEYIDSEKKKLEKLKGSSEESDQ